MIGCTGITSLEPLSSTTIEYLYMDDCTGITSLEPLSSTSIKRLFIRRCNPNLDTTILDSKVPPVFIFR